MNYGLLQQHRLNLITVFDSTDLESQKMRSFLQYFGAKLAK